MKYYLLKDTYVFKAIQINQEHQDGLEAFLPFLCQCLAIRLRIEAKFGRLFIAIDGFNHPLLYLLLCPVLKRFHDVGFQRQLVRNTNLELRYLVNLVYLVELCRFGVQLIQAFPFVHHQNHLIVVSYIYPLVDVNRWRYRDLCMRLFQLDETSLIIFIDDVAIARIDGQKSQTMIQSKNCHLLKGFGICFVNGELRRSA